MARFPRTSGFVAHLHQVSEYQMAWDGASRMAYTEHINLDPYGRRPSALGCTRSTPNMSKPETNDMSLWCKNQKSLHTSTLTSFEGLSLKKTKKSSSWSWTQTTCSSPTLTTQESSSTSSRNNWTTLLRRHHIARLNIIWACTYFTIRKRAFSL